MAKLTKKISSGKDNVPQRDIKPPDNEESKGVLEEKISGLYVSTDLNIKSDKYLTNWLLSKIGEKSIQKIQGNPNFLLPYTEKDMLPAQWLNRAIKTLLKTNDLTEIAADIRKKEDEIGDYLKSLKVEINEITSLNDQLKKQNERLIKEREDLKATTHSLQKRLRQSVSAKELIQRFFDKDEKAAGVVHLLNEAVDSAESGFSSFFPLFLNSWDELKTTLDILPEKETNKLEMLDKTLESLLTNLSNQFIPQRRALLEAIARIASEPLDNFTFISPEETLRINPEIHDVKGAGGDRIKEGRSFAIIRRKNGQIYKYAKVEVV